MRGKSANLVRAVERLETILGDVGPDQVTRLKQALAQVEDAVWQRIVALKPVDGKIVKVDRPRLPSPGVDRRADKLCAELEHFLEEAQALRASARETGTAPQDPATLGGALPVAPEVGAVADWGVFVQRARRLVADLEEYENQEAELIYDSINTDIGSPD
jgi:hypothetical protein